MFDVAAAADLAIAGLQRCSSQIHCNRPHSDSHRFAVNQTCNLMLKRLRRLQCCLSLLLQNL